MAKDYIPGKGEPGYWEHMRQAGMKAIKASRGGRPKKIESPEKMWEYACRYFEEVDNTPYKKQDFIRGGELAGSKVNLDNARPYSWAGFETFMIRHGIISNLDHYRANTNDAYAEFRGVIASIDKVMFDNKFEGAAVGAFNQSVIVRDLQLAEVTRSEVKASVKNEIDYTKLSVEALTEIARQSELYADKDRSQ